MKSTLSAARAAALAKRPATTMTASERDLSIRFSLFNEMQSCESGAVRCRGASGPAKGSPAQPFRKTAKAKTVPDQRYFSFPHVVEELSVSSCQQALRRH